jgi:predicted negative regulator of RcsB-dependent stress response
MDIHRSLDNRIGQSIVHARLGRLYFRRQQAGDLEKAKGQLEKALSISRGAGHSRATIDFLRTYGDVLLALDSRENACAAWAEAISLQQAAGLGPREQKWFEDKMHSAACIN